MSDKPKFLYRPNEYGDWYAKLGRTIKANKRDGIPSDDLRDRHKQIRVFQRRYKARLRYLKWAKVYKEKFHSEYAKALKKDMTENDADKHARRKAEKAVVFKFPKKNGSGMSERTVRNAMNRLNDENYMYSIFHEVDENE